MFANLSNTENIRYVEKLEKSDIQELFTGNILALRYPGFCSEVILEAGGQLEYASPLFSRRK